MAFQNQPAASVTVHTGTGGTDLDITGGDVTLDVGRYPYATASVTVPLTDITLIEQLQVGQRVDVDATDGTTTLDGDLGLIRREVSHDGRELTFTLASDEAILDTWADIDATSDARDYEADLRALVDFVLARAIPGAHLEPGTVTADITAAWPGRNLIANPVGSTDTTGWDRIPGGIGTLSTPAGGHSTNPNRLRITANSLDNIGLYYGLTDGGVAVDTGRGYSITLWARVSHTVRVIVGAYQTYRDAAAAGTYATTSVTTLSPGAWVPLRVNTGTMPYTVGKIAPRIWTIDPMPAGGWLEIDDVMVFDTFEDLDTFNGSTPFGGGYFYNWEGDPYRSASTRHPTFERPRELFHWAAGKTAWSFLAPLVASAGLRLYCDERRRWHLVDPLDHTVPGRVSVRPSNATRGQDTLDAEDEDASVTGVVVTFRWIDRDGNTQELSESAGVAGKVKTLTFDRPHPGYGMAQAHLAKLRGRRRTQAVTAATDYTVRPGQEIQIDLPGTAAQIGTLTRVTWDLTAGLMDLGSGGLRDTPPGAIDLLPGTIDALPGTINDL